jgi:redox-sensitive bicupin YhaK (pirin superfamily)
MVGPFIFIDHMGLVKLNERNNFDVLPHPHIGLSTLTFLFEGSIMHRDSLGNEMEITLGSVNWMTAGNGIVHSEGSPDYLRNSERLLHGLQIWVALPKDLERMHPEFFHIEEQEIPKWKESGTDFKLIAGEAFGRKSAMPVYSRQYMLEIESTSTRQLSMGKNLYGESGVYILEGGIQSDGNHYGAKQMLVSNESSLC